MIRYNVLCGLSRFYAPQGRPESGRIGEGQGMDVHRSLVSFYMRRASYAPRDGKSATACVHVGIGSAGNQ